MTDTPDLAQTASGDRLRLVADVMRRIRDECVWTQRIDHRDLLPYLVEESGELIDAVEDGSRADLREELGDLLWQVLFHAEIASRDTVEPFDIDDVAGDLADKMTRRHPHVFADAVARTPEEVLTLWNAAKGAEKRDRRSVLDGVPRSMPSPARAQKVLGRAASVGVRVDAAPAGRVPESEEELGEALLGLVALARERGWDVERALRTRLRTLEERVRAAESAAADAGGSRGLG